jgi:hypothetical protein
MLFIAFCAQSVALFAVKGFAFRFPRSASVPSVIKGLFYFFSDISIVARVFSQSIYMWQPVPIS